ncbi:ThuA domain-containing protein [Sphingomonas sp. SORGH_AS_0879]|uniref:ThuA domain-containing protein n=1 Tax=Sphingomonas sp. SORGH_AS_0879 TaxID=3041790 RepID=UPI00278B839C|nr:ThuA domain-containing protein [Sphingomonas sp. SORGH_AS_0879]MDQ1231330.1 type 1 glutamine amidotransferase [Sphingomonas sp. SORGH_AS_0879]
MMLKTLAMMAMIAVAQAPSDPHLPGKTVDSVAPTLPAGITRGVLIVSKTNGWRHIEHIPHSNIVLADIAKRLGRPSFTTENAAVFNDEQLSRFSVIVLNSASGDFLTPDQQAAFARFVAKGGGVVALHAAGDDSHKEPWYADTIIGTTFIGHPNGEDHIQSARVIATAPRHPILAGVRMPWVARDEWYSFSGNPATRGMTVLAEVDEASYRPGDTLRMGTHPVMWINPRAKGRVFYSALGHEPQLYGDPAYRRILTNAIRWAAR